MSRFSSRKTGTATVNRAGGAAYKQSDKLAFISLLLTNFLNDRAYSSGSDTLANLQKLCRTIKDKEFLAKGAIYARDVMNMRSVSHVVAGEIAGQVKGERWTKNFFEKIVIRPDDMREILSYYKAVYGDNEPNALKKGFAKALEKLDDYRAGKYQMKTTRPSLVDLVNLCHPKSTPTLDKLMRGNLQPPETWEVKLSTGGDKTEVFGSLLSEGKLGYMALLKNLRNIISTGDDAVIQLACKELTNENKIKKSRVLPFRFMQAMKYAENRSVLVALSQAFEVALSNVPKIEGETLVAIDASGSMTGAMVGDMCVFDIAKTFGAVLAKSNNADILMFDDEYRHYTYNPMDTTITIANNMKAPGGRTDFKQIFLGAKKRYDNIFILSDMQGWGEYNLSKHHLSKSVRDWKATHNPEVKIYSWDLAGYGDMKFPENNVYCLAGWSEKVFDLIENMNKGSQTIIDEVSKIDLDKR